METKKKYELSNKTIEFNGVTLHRIKALKDFSDVKAGDLGGWVEKEDNLSQIGDAWIGGDAVVYENAKVYHRARVFGNAEICGDAKVCDYAEICGDAKVYDHADVYNHARVFGNAEICGNAFVRGYAEIYENAKVYDHADVYNHARVFGNAEICGDAFVRGYAEICGDAVVKNNEDYIVFKNFWSSGRHFTWTRSNNMWKVGCFYGTREELIKKAYKDSTKSGKEYERVVKYVDSILAEKEKNYQI